MHKFSENLGILCVLLRKFLQNEAAFTYILYCIPVLSTTVYKVSVSILFHLLFTQAFIVLFLKFWFPYCNLQYNQWCYHSSIYQSLWHNADLKIIYRLYPMSWYWNSLPTTILKLGRLGKLEKRNKIDKILLCKWWGCQMWKNICQL